MHSADPRTSSKESANEGEALTDCTDDVAWRTSWSKSCSGSPETFNMGDNSISMKCTLWKKSLIVDHSVPGREVPV